MKFIRRFGSFAALLLLVILLAGFWVKHDELLDLAVSRNYQPTATVERLTSDTTMTSYAKRLFYANRPAIEGRQVFNQHCTDPSEQVTVLGCFVGNRLGIYLYNVTDARLTGVEQVTAAHEMLHQAYERLGKSERTRINGLLQAYFDLQATPAVKDKILSYKNSEPTQLQNEMHSIFATEVDDLPAALEAYYQRYFTNRSRILVYYHQYQSEFDKRLAQIKAYDAQLADLKAKIDANKSDLLGKEVTIRARRAELNALLAANRIDAYNAGVAPFNALIADYRNEVAATNELVNQFNGVLAQRNEIAIQEQQLQNAIDSQVDTAPTP